jgi:hypothetical protein
VVTYLWSTLKEPVVDMTGLKGILLAVTGPDVVTEVIWDEPVAIPAWSSTETPVTSRAVAYENPEHAIRIEFVPGATDPA